MGRVAGEPDCRLRMYRTCSQDRRTGQDPALRSSGGVLGSGEGVPRGGPFSSRPGLFYLLLCDVSEPGSPKHVPFYLRRVMPQPPASLLLVNVGQKPPHAHDFPLQQEVGALASVSNAS